jgi:mercuric ion transport protein
MSNESGKTIIKVGIVGTILAAVCCATPILVILLGAVGLGAMTGYLDYVLLPALAIFILVAAYGFWKKSKNNDGCCTAPKKG